MALTAVDQERGELDRVLGSPLFSKAPNQSRLLRYLCEWHFEGRADQPKEHQIAIEALGRKDSFDGREDSIVRVEAWRLRRRLRQYYDAEGSDHVVRIVLDPGQYIARFVPYENEIKEPLGDPDLVDDGHVSPEAKPPSRGRAVLCICAAVVALIAGLILIVSRSTHRAAATVSPATPEPALPFNTGNEVRILAGYNRAVHIDRLGRYWGGDRYFSGGKATELPRQFIARTTDPTIYRYCRVGNFEYNIPLKPGVYELRLYFGPSVRPWTVTDQPVDKYPLTLQVGSNEQVVNLDFAADGNSSPSPDIRVFKDVSPGPNGKLHLGFWTAGQYAFVNAIELIPGLRGRLRPIRITTRDYFYTDTQGNIWPPDRFYRGGSLVERRDSATGTEDRDLFNSERYGNFDYLIPVAKGTYAVRLGFAEMWFGPELPGGGGAGSRLFNVSCNGTPLLSKFDVFREAGGAGRALVKTIHGVRPNDDGKLRLTFTTVRNNAMLNFIEVDDESK